MFFFIFRLKTNSVHVLVTCFGLKKRGCPFPAGQRLCKMEKGTPKAVLLAMELQRGGHKDGRTVDEIVLGIVEAAFGDRQNHDDQVDRLHDHLRCAPPALVPALYHCKHFVCVRAVFPPRP